MLQRVLAALALAALLAACGAAQSSDQASFEDGGSSDPWEEGVGTAVLAWDPPTTRVDGSPLTDLAGFRVYYGRSSRSYPRVADVGSSTEAEIGGLPTGRVYFSVTAYDALGREGPLSAEVYKDIP